MLRSTYCRRQAESCLRLSETCQDPSTAEQLLIIAAEYFQRATDLEDGLVGARLQGRGGARLGSGPN
jgi:hypothetical protein